MIAISQGAEIKENVERLLRLDGTLLKIFSKYDTVLLKPNFVMPRKYAVTNLELIEELCRLSETYGVKLEIIECPGIEFSSDLIEKYLELKKTLKKYNVKIDLKPTRFKTLNIKGKRLRKITAVADFFEKPWINLFKIKTHVISTVSLGIKNTMGILRYNTRQDIHMKGVNRSLKDIANIMKPAYNLAEGFPGMEGNGPTFGEIRPLNILIGSDNLAQLDYFIVKEVMKINPARIEYLKDVELQDDVVGDIEYVHKIAPFIQPSASKTYLTAYNSMYLVDKFFFPLFQHHFNEVLYFSKYFGSKPVIVDKTMAQKLNKDICRFGAIDYENTEINYSKCLLCMECVDVYPNVFKIMSMRNRFT